MLHDLTHIPLDQLKPSKLNVRRHGTKDIDSLAASIASLGLLHPLLVRATGGGFEIVAGRRRYLAVRKLQADGTSAPQTLPCVVMEAADDAAAIEASLAENVARLPMDELDQFEAFAQLAKRGMAEEDIARHFAVSTTIVRRRLAIARLHPGIRRLYRENEIDAKTLELLTLATRERQQAWLDLVTTDPGAAPPPWRLKSWLLGGTEIATKTALFDETLCQNGIITDLFGEDRYFADPMEFWHLQNAAIAAERDRLLAAGWSAVEIVGPDRHFDTWAYDKAVKARGGAVVIEVEANGEVTLHKGLVLRGRNGMAQAVEADGARESPTPAARPEMTRPLANYVDLIRHSSVRLAVAEAPQLALRLMLAHVLGGGRLWQVKAEPQQPATTEIATALRALPSRSAFETLRREAVTLLGEEEDSETLIPPGQDGTRTAVLFARLCDLSDSEVLRFTAIVMAETLAAGTGLIDALGRKLAVDVAAHWQPDDTFFALVRDRDVLSGMLAEVIGEDAARCHLTDTGTKKKAIVRNALAGDGRAKAASWLPRYMLFPQEGYTMRPLTPTAEAAA